jgi:hypothetical protein
MKRPVVDTNTILAVVGLAALAAGLALVYLPASLVTVGALLILYAILPDRSAGGTA